jgi:hypothetical protein
VSCEAFVAKKFQPKTLALIGKMNSIIADYMTRGFVLTLRQLYYQLVARMIIENLQSEYKRMGSIVNDARLAGLMGTGAASRTGRDICAGCPGGHRPAISSTPRQALTVRMSGATRRRGSRSGLRKMPCSV